MHKPELLATLAELDLHPSRRLGQNFLLDGNFQRAMATEARAGHGELLVEIGPGLGAVTDHLLADPRPLLAIEYDLRLHEFLAARFAHRRDWRIVQADAARTDYDELLGDTPWDCVGSLPYAAASPILGQLLAARNRPGRAVFLLQREMAQRLLAAPGGKDYGSLTVMVQSHYQMLSQRQAPPELFWPRPDVTSTLLTLERHGPGGGAEDAEAWRRFLRQAFSQRRKKLRHNLRGLCPAAAADRALASLGLPPDCRPQQLSVTDFQRLYQTLATGSRS